MNSRSPGELLADAAVVALPLVVGGAGSRWTADASPTWYRRLDKPSWNPPGWLFGPVWAVLYLGMGLALLRVVRSDRRRPRVRWAVGLFALQLALNLGWSWVFFGLRRPGAALAEILALHASITATTVAFWRVRPSAGALLLPYLAWTTFATALNARIWQLND